MYGVHPSFGLVDGVELEEAEAAAGSRVPVAHNARLAKRQQVGCQLALQLRVAHVVGQLAQHDRLRRLNATAGIGRWRAASTSPLMISTAAAAAAAAAVVVVIRCGCVVCVGDANGSLERLLLVER